MFKQKLRLMLQSLCYSISLGSLVYVWPKYQELFIFLQIITLPAIYHIGYEIILHKQKKKFELEKKKAKVLYFQIYNAVTKIMEKQRKFIGMIGN
ncbi:hypothetical protein CL619_03805 [archaeon]|nr:hypothetical protein [archaeon]|tara:strand:+ start:781 stop:1065 length:285 start_codon:yes stop_codon:yes gene_type:complete